MKCFVTGGSGFIGANLVHALLARGHSVKALLRPGTSVPGIAASEIEIETGDVLQEVGKLTKALSGCDWCFHVAASYQLWLRDYAPMYATNVQGTQNVISAACEAKCQRIVYTSTVGCIGLPVFAGGKLVPSNEQTPASLAQMSNHYKRSKWLAESAALEAGKRGAPVVIVNPSAPIGPWDVKPTPTGKIIVDFLHRRIPAYLETGLNWVDVRDVAIGHILAAEIGRIGERYILGNARGNWTMKETLDCLETLTGLPAPRFRVPIWIAFLAAYLGEAIARVTNRPPKAPLAGVRMARYKMFFDPRKAIQELGLPQTPPETAFKDAVGWFRANAY